MLPGSGLSSGTPSQQLSINFQHCSVKCDSRSGRVPFFHTRPQLIFIRTLFKIQRQTNLAGTDVPEEYAKCIDVNTAVVFSRKQFRSHMNRRSNNRTRHHGFRLAKPKIGYLGSVFTVKLYNTRKNILLNNAIFIKSSFSKFLWCIKYY